MSSEVSDFFKQPIKYGRYGQVEPAQLKLEVIICDGVQVHDDRVPASLSGTETLLRHDKGVFSAGQPTISLILQHQDDTPFCLEQLHIIGPESGFSAPVREGQVYVAMDFDALLKYHDPVSRAHRRPPPPRHHRTARDEQISLSDALRDPLISIAHDAQQRQESDEDPPVRWHSSPDPLDVEALFSGESSADLDPACEPFDVDLSSVDDDQDSTHVASLTDEDPGPEEASAPDVLIWRDRLDRLARLSRLNHGGGYELPDDVLRWHRPTVPPASTGPTQARGTRAQVSHAMARQMAQVGFDPSRLDLPWIASAREGHATTARAEERAARPTKSTEPAPEDGDDPRVVKTHFEIAHGKHKVTMNFRPALSGRFILLKLRSHRDSLDVQSIVAKGYGGCRYFPAMEFR